MPTTDRQAIAIRLEVLQVKRLTCLERLAKESTWGNAILADYEAGMVAAFDRCILDLMMERQAVE